MGNRSITINETLVNKNRSFVSIDPELIVENLLFLFGDLNKLFKQFVQILQFTWLDDPFECSANFILHNTFETL
ncbi:MAG: hypothetical protein ACO23R_19775, partial [bacterium]